MKSLWGGLWWLPFTPLLFLFFAIAVGDARSEHFVIIAAILIAASASALTRDFLIATVPGVAIGLGYEAIRYLRPYFVTPDRVLACELQSIDANLFGFGTGMAPPDLFVRYNDPLADLAFALPYTTFWMVVIGYCLALFFADRHLLRRYLWTLALTHAVAFVFWLGLPAAPPWYVRAEGCGIDTSVLPSAAALSRLDAMFGMSYFEAFYSRSPTVFGALPSLHVAFPAVALVTGWAGFRYRGRLIAGALVLWMLAASVYLDHHWLLDGVISIGIVLLVHAVLMRVWPGYRGQQGAPSSRGNTDAAYH